MNISLHPEHKTTGTLALRIPGWVKTYCVFRNGENGSNLASVFVDTGQELSEHYEPELLGGTTVICLKGKKITESCWDDDTLYRECKTELEDIELKAVPYCHWGNRTTGEMLVWIKELL